MAVILMVGTLLFSATLQVHHVYAVVDLVTGKTDEAVLAAAADNGPEIFRGIREGAGVARRYEKGTFDYFNVFSNDYSLRQLQTNFDL